MNTGAVETRRSNTARAVPEFIEHTVSLSGGVLGYRECGSGTQAIVLLHGISSGSGSWAQCAMLMAPHARVIAWDAPGYGASTALDAPAPVATDYAARLHQLLAWLGIEGCLLVGHSLGALMAAAYSSLNDQRAEGFVLLSPALGYKAAGHAQADQVRRRRLGALSQLGIEGMAKNLPDRLLTATAGYTARQEVRRNALRLNKQGYTQAVELLCGDDIDRYRLPQNRCRVYCGEHDIVTTPQQSAAYAQRHGFPFALIPGAGHACYIERPDIVAERLLEAMTMQGARQIP